MRRKRGLDRGPTDFLCRCGKVERAHDGWILARACPQRQARGFCHLASPQNHGDSRERKNWLWLVLSGPDNVRLSAVNTLVVTASQPLRLEDDSTTVLRPEGPINRIDTAPLETVRLPALVS